LILLGLGLAACGTNAGGDVDATADVADTADTPDTDVVGGFDDHTVAGFASSAALLAYAGPEQEPAQVKFILTGFQDALPKAVFEETGFYALHDEWAWFRLLNGAEVPGIGLAPVTGLSFATVADVVAWARTQVPTSLPVGLQWAGDRLYLKRFYDRSFGADRTYGLGSVLHYAANPKRVLPAELWLFELEYVDRPTRAQVEHTFQALEALLPAEVGSNLKWLVRATWQQAVADQMAAEGSAYAGRVVTYDDLVVEGAWEVYNQGLAAGLVKIVPKGQFSGASLGENHLVVLAEVPDDLPPVAGIITAVPQTPLAHIGLLAKSRGTPNVYVAGAATSQQFDVWDSYRQPLLLKATTEGVTYRELTKDQWKAYLALKTPQTLLVPMADLTGAPLSLQFDGLGLAAMASNVPLIGGKSAGFMALIEQGYEVPDGVMALTVKAYAEHVQALPFSLADLLATADFVTDSRVRFLALEGEEAFRDEFATLPDTVTWLDDYLAAKVVPGSALALAIAADGVRNAIEDQPVAPATLAALEALLKEHFAFLAPTQGLRFRSSSTAEDIEGFNGAGLYDSNTGYLFPELQSDPDKRKKTIAWALGKTWGSYWIFGAFEERRAAGIDHLTGRMGAGVHPVFDDAAELSNGVITVELVRRPTGNVLTTTVNVQKGPLSVTNPPPGSNAAPEIDVVRQEGTQLPHLKRVQPSTEVAAGQVLLSDAELGDLHARLSELAGPWLDTRNSHYVKPQRDTTITLDVEIKRMAEGWPALADGTVRPERLVFKQVRTLHDSYRHAAAVQTLPLPRDVLGKTTRVVKRTCTGSDLTLVTVEAFTDPTRPWPFDNATSPFTAYVVVQFAAWPDWLGVPEGTMLSVMHTDATAITHPGMADGGPWTLDVQLAPPSKVGFDRLQVAADGAWTMTVNEEAHGGAALTCTTTPLLTTPQAYLEELL